MNRPLTQDEWDETFSRPHELDPTQECWGLFAYWDAPPPVCGSGMGSFHWFRTEGELVAFIRDYTAWWNPAPSSMEPEGIAAEVQAIVDTESGDLSKMTERPNDFMRNMWCIVWHGQFVELCEGTGEFPVRVSTSFYDDEEEPEAGVISQEDVDKFTEYLQMYGF